MNCFSTSSLGKLLVSSQVDAHGEYLSTGHLHVSVSLVFVELKFENINYGVSNTENEQFLEFSPINFILIRHIDAHDE